MPGLLIPAATRALQLVQQAAKRINLVLVGELLPFGVLDQLQNFFHAFQRLFQGDDDRRHFINRLTDGRSGRGRLSCGRRTLFGRHRLPGRHGGRLPGLSG